MVPDGRIPCIQKPGQKLGSQSIRTYVRRHSENAIVRSDVTSRWPFGKGSLTGIDGVPGNESSRATGFLRLLLDVDRKRKECAILVPANLERTHDRIRVERAINMGIDLIRVVIPDRRLHL